MNLIFSNKRAVNMEDDSKKKMLLELLKGQIVAAEFKTYSEIREHFTHELMASLKQSYITVFPSLENLSASKHETVSRQVFWTTIQLFDNIVDIIDKFRDENQEVRWNDSIKINQTEKIDNLMESLYSLLPEEDKVLINKEVELVKKYESLKLEIHSAIKKQVVDYFPILFEFTTNGYKEMNIVTKNFALMLYNIIMDEIGDFAISNNH